MEWHFLGDVPYPTPYKASATVHETSLAVIQFMELARGERVVQAPANPFKVEMIKAEEHYCLLCFGVRWFDVIYGNDQQVAFSYRRCRHCGKESGG